MSFKIYFFLLDASKIATTPIKNSDLKWEICVATCIIRPPVVTPEMNEIEKKYSDLIRKLETRGSLKSDHEMKHLEESLKAELIKAGRDEGGVEDATKQTAVEFEHASKDELEAFTFSSRVTG